MQGSVMMVMVIHVAVESSARKSMRMRVPVAVMRSADAGIVARRRVVLVAVFVVVVVVVDVLVVGYLGLSVPVSVSRRRVASTTVLHAAVPFKVAEVRGRIDGVAVSSAVVVLCVDVVEGGGHGTLGNVQEYVVVVVAVVVAGDVEVVSDSVINEKGCE